MIHSCNFTYVNANNSLSYVICFFFLFFFHTIYLKKKALDYAQTINIPYHFKLLSQTNGTF